MPDVFQKKILVAPLDWGLGHATRCVPVINEFLKRGCHVQIASSGTALTLLRGEFPLLKFHSISSYRVSYSSSVPLVIKILLQMPKFLWAIRNEHRQVERIVEDEKIDIVISDNRYGCRSSKTKNVFIGHQLFLRVPFFLRWVNHFHELAIKKFSACWVPDEIELNLGGDLSINHNIHSKKIGLLSRMQWQESIQKYDLIVILSGPEPQRTLFEQIILLQLKEFRGNFFVVRGIPDSGQAISLIESANHLSAEKLNQMILQSNMVLSRPGYSTLMDLSVLGKKAIFVPTPGQPEQAYLADKLMKKKIAFSMSQDKFNLHKAIEFSKDYQGFSRYSNHGELSKAIDELLNEIDQKF